MLGKEGVFMKKRILTSIVAVIVFIPFLIFADTLALPIGMSIAAFIAVWEVLHCVGLHKNVLLSIVLYPWAAAMPILMRVLGADITIRVGFVSFLLVVLYAYAVSVFSKGKVKVNDMSTAVLTVMYSAAGLTGIIYLHDFHEGGSAIYFLVFIGAWITDIFAYFTGFLLGKHKLIPDVSPKKTVEGSIGGIAFCTLAFLGFTLLYNQVFLPDGGRAIPYLVMIPVGIVTSVVSQVGDLAMSVLKRHYGIKDFGKLFPGHGGILDRFDSVVAVSVLLSVVLGIILG